MPEPLSETSVLANHSSDFSLTGQPNLGHPNLGHPNLGHPNLGHPDNQTRLYIELIPQLIKRGPNWGPRNLHKECAHPNIAIKKIKSVDL